MSLFGTYVGPVLHLRGERAMISPTDRFRWPHLRGRRLVWAQFNNTRTQYRLGRRGFSSPSHKKHLGFGWHAFPASHWRLDA